MLSRTWTYWKMPVLAGFGFCTLEIGLLLDRFGYSAYMPRTHHPGDWIRGVLPGLGLFFLGGVLAGLVVRRLLRGAEGPWLICLIGLTVAATPIASIGSLEGGMLLGPLVAVLWAPVPYLVFVGIPVLGRRLWLLWTTKPDRETTQ